MTRPQAPKRSFDNGERNCILSGFSSEKLSLGAERLSELLGSPLEGVIERTLGTADRVVRGLGELATITEVDRQQ